MNIAPLRSNERKLLKDHLGKKAGEVVDVTAERGNYFIKTGVATTEIEDAKKADVGKKEDQAAKNYQTKEEKPARKKK